MTSASHLNMALTLLALSGLCHVANLLQDAGAARADETRPPRPADILDPEGSVALPSLARHRAAGRAQLSALLSASLDLRALCRGELPAASLKPLAAVALRHGGAPARVPRALGPA